MHSMRIKSVLILVLVAQLSWGQGIFSGGFESNFNVYLRDSLIGAANTPQYDRELTGAEAWLNLNYSIDDYRMGVRFDMFNNSNLLVPTGSYSDVGIGRWFIGKRMGKLDIEVGYIYDQIGSGIIYRAYEERPLLIDNALLGGKVAYEINDNWRLKAFAGNQKSLFDRNEGFIKGASLEGFISLGETNPLSLSPGIGMVNRTLTDESMGLILDNLKTYIDEERFIPEYNTYAASIYNTLTYKKLSWYVEAAFKGKDVYYDPFAELKLEGGSTTGKYRNDPGSVFYTSVSLALGKLGITLEGKRTENFSFRSDPNLRLIRGVMNFIPPMNRVNTYRLTARYAPATQDLSEQAFQTDIRYRFNKKLSSLVNFSNISTLDGDLLYREAFTEVIYKQRRDWQIIGGVQYQKYNQEVYETKPEVPYVQTITPYVDFLYRFTRRNALRLEAQYMISDQDYGSWMFALAEYSMAPNWIFTGSLMYNVDPGPNAPRDTEGTGLKILYPTIGAVYTQGSNRYALSYIKQVEGIVCSGGVCRLEPAFSGVRFSINSTF